VQAFQYTGAIDQEQIKLYVWCTDPLKRNIFSYTQYEPTKSQRCRQYKTFMSLVLFKYLENRNT